MNMQPRLDFLRGHVGSVHAVAFSPDCGALVSGGRDGEVKVWDVATGRLLRTLQAEWMQVQAVAFSPDGQTIAAAGWGNDSTAEDQIRLWRARDGALLQTIASEWVE